MKYMARQTTLWKDDTGHYVKVVAGVTVVESERNLEDDAPPYFYKIEKSKEKKSINPSFEKTTKSFKTIIYDAEDFD